MTIFKNGLGDTVAFLPKICLVDPHAVDYEHSKPQKSAGYNDLCGDIIRGCDIGIEQLQKLRADYEKRRVMYGMGVPPVFDVVKG